MFSFCLHYRWRYKPVAKSLFSSEKSTKNSDFEVILKLSSKMEALILEPQEILGLFVQQVSQILTLLSLLRSHVLSGFSSTLSAL